MTELEIKQDEMGRYVIEELSLQIHPDLVLDFGDGIQISDRNMTATKCIFSGGRKGWLMVSSLVKSHTFETSIREILMSDWLKDKA